MADKKISQLPLASTPLAGGETLPIVQTGATVQVSVNNLTAGRGISATSVTNGLGAVGTPSYTFTGDTNTGMWSPSADAIAFSTAGAERMRVSDAGNIGIGATVPGATGIAPFVAIGANNAGIGSASANNIAIVTANTERMRITNAGSVGIGTTVPQRILHLATAEPTVVLQSTSAAVDENRWRTRVSTTGNFSIGTINDAFDAGQDAYQIIRGTGIAVAEHRFITANTERMRIDSSGNLLVATTSASASNTGDGFVVSGANSSLTSRRASGASQTHAIFVNGGATVGSISTSTTATTYNTSSTSGITGVDANTVAIRTNSAERMRIDSSGNVGIGTTSPNAAARLDVTSTTSGFLPPRMTTTQRDAIGSPPNGLMLYNTTTDKLQVRAGGAWVDLH
jgi:hypothetical protein